MDASGVGVAFANRNSGLADVVRFFRTELDPRHVVSCTRRFGLHGNGVATMFEDLAVEVLRNTSTGL